jgi:hypothetical protein
MASDAVLCTGCGYNRRTGSRLSVEVGGQQPAASPAKQPADPATRAKREKQMAAAGRGIGLVVKLVLAVALVGGAAWIAKSFASWDPEGQGKAKLAQLGTGQTVKQVVDICGKPAEVYRIIPFGERNQTLKPGTAARVGYMDNFVEAYGKEKLVDGFYLVYRFSGAGEWQVMFDGDGNYLGKEETPNLFRQ